MTSGSRVRWLVLVVGGILLVLWVLKGTSYVSNRGPHHAWTSGEEEAVGPECRAFVGSWAWYGRGRKVLYLKADLTFWYRSRARHRGPHREITGRWTVERGELVLKPTGSRSASLRLQLREIQHHTPPSSLESLVSQ